MEPYKNSELAAMLKRRGFRIIAANPRDKLFFPQERRGGLEDDLYGQLKKYSFRIFMRDVIQKRDGFCEEDLMRYVSRRAVRGYIDFLVERNIAIDKGEGLYRLSKKTVRSFGETLEWYVAKIFEREFAAHAMWGVRLKGGISGGDYDVIAAFEGRLVYVEAKSSPPGNVQEGEIVSFLSRTAELAPSLAIFLEDTQLRMQDKIVPFFEKAANSRGLAVEKVQEEIYTIGGRIFITNSKRDIAGNLAVCIRHHLRSDNIL